jgi:hypothetical protein
MAAGIYVGIGVGVVVKFADQPSNGTVRSTPSLDLITVISCETETT